ncbi:hypothetical protein J6590_031809 [Homalodisca vitripennis]|nr:hypothetical protein J6590_031809 [Homalodisca vitripennis]
MEFSWWNWNRLPQDRRNTTVGRSVARHTRAQGRGWDTDGMRETLEGTSIAHLGRFPPSPPMTERQTITPNDILVPRNDQPGITSCQSAVLLNNSALLFAIPLHLVSLCLRFK